MLKAIAVAIAILLSSLGDPSLDIYLGAGAFLLAAVLWRIRRAIPCGEEGTVTKAKEFGGTYPANPYLPG